MHFLFMFRTPSFVVSSILCQRLQEHVSQTQQYQTEAATQKQSAEHHASQAESARQDAENARKETEVIIIQIKQNGQIKHEI